MVLAWHTSSRRAKMLARSRGGNGCGVSNIIHRKSGRQRNSLSRGESKRADSLRVGLRRQGPEGLPHLRTFPASDRGHGHRASSTSEYVVVDMDEAAPRRRAIEAWSHGEEQLTRRSRTGCHDCSENNCSRPGIETHRAEPWPEEFAKWISALSASRPRSRSATPAI